MDDVRIALVVAGFGFSAGFLCAWWYFLANGLIRTRREYYAARQTEGHEVPGGWDEEDA